MKKFVIILIIVDVFIAVCFFLTYGPISKFRDFIITTAMTTKSHKYLAKTFYSDETINKVLSNNYVSSFTEGTNADDITIGDESDGNYSSVYEKEILEHEKNAVYKLIEFKYEGYNVFLTAIYDPSRVSLATSANLGTSGEKLTTMASKNKALVAINAGGFSDENYDGTGGVPTGSVIKNSKIVWNGNNYSGGIIGFNQDDVLVLSYDTPVNAVKNGMRDAVQFGPFLIVNGKEAVISGNGGWGINPRTAIAQRKDGIVLFLVIDGNGTNKYNLSGRGGVDMNGLIAILKRYGAYNAANLDGGASTTMVVKNELYNSPCGWDSDGQRELPDAWMVK